MENPVYLCELDALPRGTTRSLRRDYNSVTQDLESEKEMRSKLTFDEIEAQIRKALEDSNRRSGKTRSFEEVLEMLAQEKAVVCSSCGMLILSGKHSKVYSNMYLHFVSNVNCMRNQLSRLRTWEQI